MTYFKAQSKTGLKICIIAGIMPFEGMFNSKQMFCDKILIF